MGRKAKRCAAKKHGRDVAPADGAASATGGEGSTAGDTRLPKANIVRLMQEVIPKSVKISERAKDLTNDCAVDFVDFITGDACDQATEQRRRIIAPEDAISSFQTLGFDEYVKPMGTFMRRNREQASAGWPGGSALPPAPPATTAAASTAPGAPHLSDEAGTSVQARPQPEDGDGYN